VNVLLTFGILSQKMLLILVHFPYLGSQLTRSTFLHLSDVLAVLHTFVYVHFILVIHKATVSASISLVYLVQCFLLVH